MRMTKSAILGVLIGSALLAACSPSGTAVSDPTLPCEAGSTAKSAVDGMVMQCVPAGAFTMGAEGERGWEFMQPVHEVTLDAYWIDRTHVTNRQYQLCEQAGACDPPNSTSSRTREEYYGNPEFDDFPVIWVSWLDADAYCTWAGRSLPTEAQWEKAARGTDGRFYPWGNYPLDGELPAGASSPDDLLNMKAEGGDTTKVGSYPLGASPYGVLDMAGNAWQWVADWYADDYYKVSPASNPTGPDSGEARVIRGGAFEVDGFFFEYSGDSMNRRGITPDDSADIAGFRCALSP